MSINIYWKVLQLKGVKAEYQNRQILKNMSVGKEQCRNRFRSSLPVRNRYNQPTGIGCSSLQLFITSLHGLLWLQSTITGSFLPALCSFCSWNILIWWCTQLWVHILFLLTNVSARCQLCGLDTSFSSN